MWVAAQDDFSRITRGEQVHVPAMHLMDRMLIPVQGEAGEWRTGVIDIPTQRVNLEDATGQEREGEAATLRTWIVIQ